MKYECVIIGGGASGLMLAATHQVNKGLLLESTDRFGSKLLMSGGGHCNITHAGSIKDFINCYGEAGPVLRKCLYKHSNIELLDWLNSQSIEVQEIDGRYFPASMESREVLNMLLKSAKDNGWELKSNSPVKKISQYGNDWMVDGYLSEKVVIATGGITYPKTGSDGSMFEILKGLGVEVTDLRSALAPIYVKDYPYAELSGIAVSNVTVTAFSSDMNTCKGKAARLTGDILFTHNGFSGPVILNISRSAEVGEVIRINYNCELNDLPKRLRKVLEDRSRNNSGDIKTSKLKGLLESDEFIVQSIDDNGMVTRGGIDLSEIDTGTMSLKRYPGLFAIGEALDADGLTGGYNLQLCYSTARTCADNL